MLIIWTKGSIHTDSCDRHCREGWMLGIIVAWAMREGSLDKKEER